MIQIKCYSLDQIGDVVQLKVTCRSPEQAWEMYRKVKGLIEEVQWAELQAMNRHVDSTDTGHARPKSDVARDV